MTFNNLKIIVRPVQCWRWLRASKTSRACTKHLVSEATACVLSDVIWSKNDRKNFVPAFSLRRLESVNKPAWIGVHNPNMVTCEKSSCSEQLFNLNGEVLNIAYVNVDRLQAKEAGSSCLQITHDELKGRKCDEKLIPICQCESASGKY